MRDYQPRLESGRSRRRRPGAFLGWLALPVLVATATVLYAAFGLHASESTSENDVRTPVTDGIVSNEPISVPLPLPEQLEQPLRQGEAPTRSLPAAVTKAAVAGPTGVKESPSAPPGQGISVPLEKADDSSGNWLSHEIVAGDTLSGIFGKFDLSANLLYRIVNSSDEARQLAHIQPGAQIRVKLDTDGRLQQLVYQTDPATSLQITAQADGFETRSLTRQLEERIAHASGTIDSSLFVAAQMAGLSDRLTMELAGIFGWDIDFALEIRPGDQFTVIYREDWLDGKKLQDGPILAAEFVNQGKVYRAVRYVNVRGKADYYAPDGKRMRKAFLRTPVKFSRISSKFSLRRWHPLLKTRRPHRGVDYAAPTGTPVKAAGDGKIAFRGTKGGFGNVIFIQHGGKYTTVYGHLSRFAKGIKNGSRVSQGDVIGYVGQTGLASGPHLHYEFRVNGVHRNPLSVKLPAAEPIEKQYLADFQKNTRPLLSQIDVLSRTLIAHADNNPN